MIKVSKPWDGLHNQEVLASENGVYKVSDLVALSKDLEVMDIPLKHLSIGREFDTNGIRDFVSHMKAVMDSDLKYPIILDQDGDILDGSHRVCKAIYQGKETIKAVRFEENPEPSYYQD